MRRPTKEYMKVVGKGGKAKMRSQKVSTWVRITESNTRRARYEAAGNKIK